MDAGREPEAARLGGTGLTEEAFGSRIAQRAIAAFESRDFPQLTTLLSEARSDAALFLDRFRGSDHFLVNDNTAGRWQAWLTSAEGQAALARALFGIMSFVHLVNLGGAPAHDKRHLIKDALAGFRFCLEDDLHGADTLFLIPALLHDVGRLVEPELLKLDVGYQNQDHCALSFWATKTILEAVETFDVTLRDHLLYAVLQHQGANDPDTRKVFLYATQRGDREQICGPEGITRQLASDLTQCTYKRLTLLGEGSETWETNLPKPYTIEGHSWYRHVEFYLRNLHPSIGSRAGERSDELKAVTGRFLLIAAPERLARQLFAPEHARDIGETAVTEGYKKILSPKLWSQMTDPLASSVQTRMSDLLARNNGQRLLALAVHPAFAARTDSIPADGGQPGMVWDVLQSKVNLLAETDRLRFEEGLAYLIAVREEHDRADVSILRAAMRRYSENSLPYRMAAAILEEYESVEGLSR